jgi:hypothetical protein
MDFSKEFDKDLNEAYEYYCIKNNAQISKEQFVVSVLRKFIYELIGEKRALAHGQKIETKS